MEEVTSIILVTRNNLDYTRDCLRSVNQYTAEPHELILVDNASDDGTQEYLRTVPHAQVIRMDEETSFTACLNRGMEEAIGDFILLLDPACYVTEGWLGRLIEGLQAEPRAGAAGPLTNISLSNPVQSFAHFGERMRGARTARGLSPDEVAAAAGVAAAQVTAWERGTAEPSPEELSALSSALGGADLARWLEESRSLALPYQDLQGVQAFGEQLARENHGQYVDVPSLSLFCWLMPQETYEKAGPLDAELTVFAGQDYSLRLRLNQKKLRLVKDVFVHRSYITPVEDQLEPDNRRFQEKWQKVRGNLAQRAGEQG